MDTRAEEKPHQGGCLVIEHFASLVAKQNERIPAEIRQLIISAIESAPPEFQWPVFRSAIACRMLDGVEGLWRTFLTQNPLGPISLTRRNVFLSAIQLVLTEYPTTLTSGSPWTNIVVDTYQILIGRKRCRGEQCNDSDDENDGMADVDDSMSSNRPRENHPSTKYNRIRKEQLNGTEEYDDWKLAVRFSFPFAGDHEAEIMRILDSYAGKT